MLRLIVAVLAVWRVTHLLAEEDGPGDVFVRLRRLLGHSFLGGLLDCFYCLSLWVAAPLGWRLGHGWLERVLIWLALSGAAILLERATSRGVHPPVPVWQESPLPPDERST